MGKRSRLRTEAGMREVLSELQENNDRLRFLLHDLAYRHAHTPHGGPCICLPHQQVRKELGHNCETPPKPQSQETCEHDKGLTDYCQPCGRTANNKWKPKK